jgi:hypothetical protein
MKLHNQFYSDEGRTIESKLKRIKGIVPENPIKRNSSEDFTTIEVRKKSLKEKMLKQYNEQEHQQNFSFVLSGEELDDLNDLLEYAELFHLVRSQNLKHQDSIEKAATILIAEKPKEPKVRMRMALEVFGLGSIRNLKAKKSKEMAGEYESLLTQLNSEERFLRFKPSFFKCVDGRVFYEGWAGFIYSTRQISLTEKKMKIIEVLTKVFCLASPSATRQALLQLGVKRLPKIEPKEPISK